MPTTVKRRPRRKMPSAVRAALQKRGILGAYNARPAYQRNDYLGWIDAAHRDATKAKRLQQMLRELERGGVYMGMKHAPSEKNGARRAARRSQVRTAGHQARTGAASTDMRA